MAERTPEQIAEIVATYDAALAEAGGDIEALTDWAVSAKNKLMVLDLQGRAIELLKKETQLIANRDQLADDRQAFDKEKEGLEAKTAALGPEGETRAEAERRKIMEPPFEATMAEVEAFSVEQHAKWIEAGSHLREEEEEGPSEEEAKARQTEIERIEKLSMKAYAAEREAERKEPDKTVLGGQKQGRA